ncbi:MAG: hypothetical protein ACREVR_03875 [Burkholderiales bacterium]
MRAKVMAVRIAALFGSQIGLRASVHPLWVRYRVSGMPAMLQPRTYLGG